MNTKIFLGIDAGKKEHALAALDGNEQVIWETRLRNTHEGFSPLLMRIQDWQKDGTEIWIGAEGVGGYLSPLDRILCELGCKYVSIQPKQYQLFREMSEWQPDKTDEKDARGLAEFLHWQIKKQKASVSELCDDCFNTLQTTARALNQTIKSKVAIQNQLESATREYWPEIIIEDYFSRTDTKGFLALLQTYPTPQTVVKAGRVKVAKVLSAASGGDQKALADRLVKGAKAIVKLSSVSSPKASVVQSLAEGVSRLMGIISDLERQMEEQLQQHPFGIWLLKQEGIGPRTAGCFLGEAGNLDRFDTDAQLSRYAGTGATINQSGQSKGHHWDAHRYNHRLKRALLLMAVSRSRYHADSKLYVASRKNKKDDYWKAIKKLARYLIRLIWNAWQKICPKEGRQSQTVEAI